MACDRDTIIADAVTSGIWCETNKINLLRLIAQLTCEAAQGGGGGGGGGPTCANYGGGQPDFIPASGCGNAIDISDGTIYWYYSGAWHP